MEREKTAARKYYKWSICHFFNSLFLKNVFLFFRKNSFFRGTTIFIWRVACNCTTLCIYLVGLVVANLTIIQRFIHSFHPQSITTNAYDNDHNNNNNIVFSLSLSTPFSSFRFFFHLGMFFHLQSFLLFHFSSVPFSFLDLFYIHIAFPGPFSLISYTGSWTSI